MITESYNDSNNKTSNSFLTVGIGASAGGITSLKNFFTATPAKSGMAFVVILHLSPNHESQLDEILQSVTNMSVIQVHETLEVEPDHVYVIPPDKYLVMKDGQIRLTEANRTNGRPLPIDLFFRTMADAYQKQSVAIVMSGTGSDGTLGLKRVNEAGGICIAQDPQEADYEDMPVSAINTRLVDVVLPVAQMPKKLQDFKRANERFRPTHEEAKNRAKGLEPNALHDVLTFLKKETGHDFTNYKRPTMIRRMTRRMQVHNLEDIPSYFSFLQTNSQEVQLLLRDLLISVTNFFRDKEAFEALQSTVIPELFKKKDAEDEVRAWCVACATGEEAYSLAILLAEHADTLTHSPKIQVFATDIDESALAEARTGRYDQSIELDVSSSRLKRFFSKQDSVYTVREELREMVLFAPHNILHDPPFSRQDLVMCRNLLIYLDRAAQEKVFEIFHFALRPNGTLFLGSSESAESMPSLFSALNKKQRLYQARPAAVRQGIPTAPFIQRQAKKLDTQDLQKKVAPASFSKLHDKLVAQYVSPSVLVDENYDILHTSGNATALLRFVGGQPTHNILHSVLPSLKQDLQAALVTAWDRHDLTEARNVRVDQDGDRFVNIFVHPIKSPPAAEGFSLIIFDEIKGEEIPSEILKTVLESGKNDASQTVIARLEEELESTKERLRLTIEEQETTVEELKASNEELQAMNEELRSTTEKLETGKEELQSVNEEMSTVNHELKEKVDEVSRANSDLHNLMASTDIGTIFLDRSLQIQLYTPPVQKLFNIIISDLGRPLEHITNKLDYHALIDDASEVLRNLNSIEREVPAETGRWFLVRLTPYRTMDDHIDGVVITFLDFTERKAMEETFKNNDHRKDVFLATLAHELRNPLAPIRGGLELIQRSQNDPKITEHTLGVIARQTNRMIRLVDDLLEISRITQGKIKLRKEHFEIKEAVDAAIESCNDDIKAKEHQFSVSLPDAPVYLDADLVRIEQILLNLLTNAVKYTSPEGKIRLTVAKTDKEVFISVRDNGMGLAAERIDSIFRMFRQVERHSGSSCNGLGIGLSVVKQLTEMHGGSVSVTSEGQGKGSEFTVRLPLADSTNSRKYLSKREKTMKEEKTAVAHRKVLIIDDNVDVADLMKTYLSMDGHDVRVEKNGETGIETAKTFQPDVCLCDIGLPDMSGHEAGRQLREILPETRLIAFSGWGNDDDKKRSQEAGFDDHVVKGADLEELTRMID